MPETAKRTARVPILGEDGRISDDYIPAAIGENVTKAEAAAKRAETAATGAEGSASAASQSATQASGSASAASESASQAQQSAETAGGAATSAQSAQMAAEAAKTAAETAQSAAAGSAQDAQQSATAAAESAANVADKFIASAKATTLDPGSQATASVENQVLTIGVPKGDKGDKGDQGDKGETGDKGDPGTAATIAVGSVTGLDAGASPTVVNSGTANAARFDFGIPKGDKGDTGDPGHTPQRGVDYWTAEDVEAVVEDAKAQAVAELAEVGNVPKRTVSDLVAHAEDAYAQKPIEVRVKGRTVKNLWPVINGVANGITVATDGIGLVTVTGTATDDADIVADVSGWATGKSYTATISFNPTGCNAYFEVQKPSGNTSINASTTGATLNVASDATKCVAGVHVGSGTTVNASFRVMLVEGDTAPDCFVPTGLHSVEPTNLVTAGKNLLNEDAPAADGVVGPQLPPGEYVLSGTLPSGASLKLLDGGADGEAVTDASSLPHSFTAGHPFTPYYAGVGGYATGLMLELGSTATAYEPPTVTTTPLPEVELRGLPDGTCDELVIGADGTCRVERNAAEYEVQGTEAIGVGEHSNGQKYAMVSDVAFTSSSSSSMLSDRYSCGKYNTIDKYAYVPDASTLVVNDNRFTDVDTAKSILASEKPRFVFVVEPTTEPQTPVTLPNLPAPTFNQYHDADVPSDTSVEYARDINLVLANLESVQAALLGGE